MEDLAYRMMLFTCYRCSMELSSFFGPLFLKFLEIDIEIDHGPKNPVPHYRNAGHQHPL